MLTLDRLIQSFEIHLKALTLAAKTISTYSRAARDMAAWMAEQGVTDAASVERELVSGYFAHIASFRTPGGVSVDYRALQQFFKWADEVEEEIQPNPMARMRPPVVPDPETKVLRKDEIARLLKCCDGKDYMDRRDRAMFCVLLDTGMRLSELGKLQVQDVNVADREAYVMGKGRRARVAPFGYETARAIDRYLRVRDEHPRKELPHLWLGERSRGMTTDGIEPDDPA